MNADDFSLDELINSVGLKSAQKAGYVNNKSSDKELGILAGNLSSIKRTIINYKSNDATLEETLDEVKTASQVACETILNFFANKGLNALANMLKSYLPGLFSPIIDLTKDFITQPITEKDKINKYFNKASELIKNVLK